MGTFLRLLFGLPDGGVWSNLVASLIWAGPAGALAVWRARVHRHRLHARLDEHAARQDAHAARLDELHASVSRLHQHHGIGTDRDP